MEHQDGETPNCASGHGRKRAFLRDSGNRAFQVPSWFPCAPRGCDCPAVGGSWTADPLAQRPPGSPAPTSVLWTSIHLPSPPGLYNSRNGSDFPKRSWRKQENVVREVQLCRFRWVWPSCLPPDQCQGRELWAGPAWPYLPSVTGLSKRPRAVTAPWD